MHMPTQHTLLLQNTIPLRGRRLRLLRASSKSQRRRLRAGGREVRRRLGIGLWRMVPGAIRLLFRGLRGALGIRRLSLNSRALVFWRRCQARRRGPVFVLDFELNYELVPRAVVQVL